MTLLLLLLDTAGPLASAYYFQPPDLAVAGAHHTVAPLLSDVPMWDAAKPLQPREKKGFRPQLVENITHRAFGRTGEPLGYIPNPRLPDSTPSIPLPPVWSSVPHMPVFGMDMCEPVIEFCDSH